jgi:hypothetical protein
MFTTKTLKTIAKSFLVLAVIGGVSVVGFVADVQAKAVAINKF